MRSVPRAAIAGRGGGCSGEAAALEQSSAICGGLCTNRNIAKQSCCWLKQKCSVSSLINCEPMSGASTNRMLGVSLSGLVIASSSWQGKLEETEGLVCVGMAAPRLGYRAERGRAGAFAGPVGSGWLCQPWLAAVPCAWAHSSVSWGGQLLIHVLPQLSFLHRFAWDWLFQT